MDISRRSVLLGVLPASALLVAGTVGDSGAGQSPRQPVPAPFDHSSVRDLARSLAHKPYHEPDSQLPETLAKLDYDQYRSIRFDPRRALWSAGGTRFRVEFFHRGFLYRERVEIYVVDQGQARPVDYSRDDFTFGLIPSPAEDDLGFAGFRIHYPINHPDYQDEICAFLGASYFRAVGRGQGYGLSARALAIKTASESGEEFPRFRSFWIETPAVDADSIVVHALLDSASATGAFRFTIRPGDETLFDTESAIYPRVDIAEAGLAPLTSMFYFDVNDRLRVDDYRAAVHDSEGLMIANGRGERIWRPLTNPTELQLSAFSDVNPRAFGLLQRRRAFFDYEDLEARYERRPSAWIEPIGDWSEGSVQLVEIPADKEIHDNIVSFWRPRQPLLAGKEYLLNYRLHWSWLGPEEAELAAAISSRCGVGPDPDSRLFVVDFVGGSLPAAVKASELQAEVRTSKGRIKRIVTQPNPDRGGCRVSFELLPDGERLIELWMRLAGGAPVSEIWLYRWQA